MAGKAGHRGWGKLRRCASGRWQASYVGPDMRRHNGHFTYTAKMDGEAFLAAERRLIERGEWTPPASRAAFKTACGTTVADYVSTWIDQRNVTEGTRYAYENNLRLYITPKPLGSLPMAALTSEAVRAWYATLDASKPTARQAVYGMLRAAMGTATDDDLFPRNPVNIAGASKLPQSRQAVILTPAELARLADGIGERLRAWVLIAGWCGLRIGEALELRRADVNADCSVISVSRGHRHVGGTCIIKSTKSGKSRNVVVPPHIRADIASHLERFVGAGDDALLFASTTGKCHLSDDTVRGAMQPTLDAIGKPTMVIHDLRHFAGSMTARVGNLVETQKRLGHTTVRASMIYQQVVDGRDSAVAEALSGLAATG
jgi:integrase